MLLSVERIQSKSGMGKSTVGRIKKEVDSYKENSKGSHPSKLSYHDKQSIIRQITTGKLDNAVQAGHPIYQQYPPLSCHTTNSQKCTQKQ
jgi:hypothetical protein